MLVTFQNKLHETTGPTMYTQATLHFLCIFLCSSCTFDQSHSLVEAGCAHKLPGCSLCGTTECETGLFCQQARKTPFYKHLHYKFVKLYEFWMFLEFLVTYRYLEALPWFRFRFWFRIIFILRVENSYFWQFSLHPSRALPAVTLVIVPLNIVI